MHSTDSTATTHASIPTTGDAQLDAEIADFAQRASINQDPAFLQSMIAMQVDMMRSNVHEHDCAVLTRTIREMIHANKIFAEYRHLRKISMFGSARIQEGEPAYTTAREFAKLASQSGYMTITGGGPGIMQACNEGAGAEKSFGLNITLPFEQESNPVVRGTPRSIDFYYFFVRKLNFVAESDAMVAFPGGFGTMDEIFETMTLIQTGRASIYPIVLLDSPGKTFWKHWDTFIHAELVDSGLICPDDMHLLHITKSPANAIHHIEHFYKVFHSYYFIGDTISIRLNHAIPALYEQALVTEFADIIKQADTVELLPTDSTDPVPCLSTMPRMRFLFTRGNYGRLRLLIDRINDAPEPD